MSNLDLWNAVEKTDPRHTKEITGKAYRGNSPKPHYLVHKATETFGPCGIGWGFEIADEKLLDGALLEPGFYERIHMARVKVWYEWGGKRGAVEHVGQTIFSGKRKDGKSFTDEDAPKKSVTDALVKALSMIGFAGDIFMGRFDDSKYVNDLTQEFREQETRQNGGGKRTQADISANKARKHREWSYIATDLAQIETLSQLQHYKEDVLTTEFMSSLGTSQFAVEQMYGQREEELSAPAEDEVEAPAEFKVTEPQTRAEYIQDCHDKIEAFPTIHALQAWWNSEAAPRRRFSLSSPEVDDLKGRVMTRRDELTQETITDAG